jgi:uncharacterized protein
MSRDVAASSLVCCASLARLAASVNPAVLVMAKAPRPGHAKTRLEPLLGAAGCARLQAELIRVAVAWGRTVGPVFAAVDPAEGVEEVGALAGPGVVAFAQHGDDLGERLIAATDWVFEHHGGPVVVIGTDMPTLGPFHAQAVRDDLASGVEAVLGPAHDGGYYLIGLRSPQPSLFGLPPDAWGGPEVLALTIGRAAEARLSVGLLRGERDLDTPGDAEALLLHHALPPTVAAVLSAPRSAAASTPRSAPDSTAPPLVAVVVPVLEEARTLAATLDHLATLDGAFETIVVDGGSGDGTAEIARAHPLAPRVLVERGGRARQLNAGAAATRASLLCFLHADSRLPPDGIASLRAALRDPDLAGGNFALRFDGDDRFSRVLTMWYRVQRRAGVYYGDSTIWVRAATFAALGGYRELPIMDDYDFVRRLERHGRTACLPGPATTSARRWKAVGVPRTILSWVVIRWLWLAGVPAERLARLYRRAR